MDSSSSNSGDPSYGPLRSQPAPEPAPFFGDDLDLEFPDRESESSVPFVDPFRDWYTVFQQHAAQHLNGQHRGVPMIGFQDLPVSVMDLLSGVKEQLIHPAEIPLDSLAPITKMADTDTQTDCCICFDVITKDQDIRRLPCKHINHQGCIDTWFKTTTRCPMCRADYLDAGVEH